MIKVTTTEAPRVYKGTDPIPYGYYTLVMTKFDYKYLVLVPQRRDLPFVVLAAFNNEEEDAIGGWCGREEQYTLTPFTGTIEVTNG